MAALLLVTGLAASALPGSAAAQETDGHGYEYVTDDAYEYPGTEQPGKPDHRKSDGKDKYPPTTEPPPEQPELPVTGARSLTVSGFGLLLVGLGMLAWMLGGRRRARI
jgi:hypothetical protein